MNSQTTQNQTTCAADEATIRAFPQQLIDAWNQGSGEAFAAPFTENADFVAFEGTHLQGRQEIASFHQQLFDTSLKGTRLKGEVKFVHLLDPQLAVMHAVARVTLPSQLEPSESRDSMQLFVVTKRDGDWRIEAVLNARRLTLERQLFLDDFDSLPAQGKRQVSDLVASLKQRHLAEKEPASR
ncbi:SgcJ/EcaC family oxidoreductase [Fischerella sp. PCC 9605]|uniref:SgcJ/EcaC family oxidoreductase n=1 Tax=Fischerella sp. PCC 9605 TaxID=1173024 RepID=UPI00047A68E1|nr:SgcJ/EcaC family oxidoreductase [Fischerella sp. PCC 9605]